MHKVVPPARLRSRRLTSAVVASASRDDPSSGHVNHCSGCLKPESCPCPKAIRRAKTSKRQSEATAKEPAVNDDGAASTAAPPPQNISTRRSLLVSFAAAAASTAATLGSSDDALALSNGAVSDAWATISGAQSDLTFPDEFLGTWLCYSSLTRVDTPQGPGLVQDMAVVDRARSDVGGQVIYPMRFIKNNQGRVVMDRAYNVVKMAEATARAYNVIDAVEWDADDPNTLRAEIRGDGRSVFFRVNQRSEEFPAPDRIETSEVAQIVFDGGENGGYAVAPAQQATAPGEGGDDSVVVGAGAALAPVGGGGASGNNGSSGGRVNQPKIKSSRTYTKWKFRPIESAGDGPSIVASQTVYDYLTSFDPGFIESKGQPVTQYTYKLALFKANQTNLDN